MRQGKFGQEAPLIQFARQASLRAGDASGDEGGFGGFVAADLLLVLQHAPLAAVADDAEPAGFRGVDVLRQHDGTTCYG